MYKVNWEKKIVHTFMLVSLCLVQISTAELTVHVEKFESFSTSIENEETMSLIIHKIISQELISDSETITSSNLVANFDARLDITILEEPKLMGKILPYPNPMSFSKENGMITYILNGNFNTTIKIYDMTATLVHEETFISAAQGGKIGYNSIPFNRNKLGYDLSSGIYFIILLNNNNLLGKGKMAIIP